MTAGGDKRYPALAIPCRQGADASRRPAGSHRTGELRQDQLRNWKTLRTVTGRWGMGPQPWTGSWTELSVQPVRSGPSAAPLRAIRAASAHSARSRTSHNPPVVGSSPTRPTWGSSRFSGELFHVCLWHCGCLAAGPVCGAQGGVRGGSVLSAGVLACGCGGVRLLAQSAARGRGGV